MKQIEHVIFTSILIRNTVNVTKEKQGAKMIDNHNLKLPQKGAGKILKTIYETNRSKSKASPELLKILNNQKKWATGPISWNALDSIVGNYGIGSFDAMIINLFMNSHFEAIITADKELAKTVSKISNGGKLVFVPDSLYFS